MVFENNEKVTHAFIVRYQPEDYWFKEGKVWEEYSGKITFFDTSGNTIGSNQYKKGMLENLDNSGSSKVACTYILISSKFICTSLDGSMGGYYGGGCEITLNYGLSCSGGTTSSGSDDGGTGDGEGDFGSGGSSGGSGNPSSSPIIDEDGNLLEEEMTVKITNLLEGKDRCAFNKLRYGNVELYKKTIGVFDNNDYYDLTIGY